MAEKTLAQKLLVKPGQRIVALNVPPVYETALGVLPEGASLSHTVEGTYDAVHVFVYNKADIDHLAPQAMAALAPGGMLWIAYPKKSGSIRTDISRDNGWDTVIDAGWDGVTQVAMDDTWSVLRFKPRADIKNLTRKTTIGKQQA